MTKNDAVSYVGTDVTSEDGIGNDVISDVVFYVFLDVIIHVLSTLFPTLFAKPFFTLINLIFMENNSWYYLK